MQETLTFWGLSASIDLAGCNRASIRNPQKIKEFVITLCDLIHMKRHGEPLVERFGEGNLEGYSLFQFIETSSITAHFDETEDRAFIDIFSCKSFDPEVAAQFCKIFFEATEMKMSSMERA